MTPLSQGQAEPTDAGDLDPRMAVDYARRMKAYCEAFDDRDWTTVSLSGSVDAQNLAGALGNLQECAAMLMNMASRLAASSAAPAADLRAALVQAVEETAVDWDGCEYDAPGGMIDIGDAIRRAMLPRIHAAAQLAAVAAPPDMVMAPVEPTREMLVAGWNAYVGDMKGGMQRFALTYRAMLAAVAAPDARVAGGEQSHLGNPAAPGSLDASRAPLSEHCAFDQGARPVRPLRMLTIDERNAVVDAKHANWNDEPIAVLLQRKFCEVNGIAPPVAQQAGSTQ